MSIFSRKPKSPPAQETEREEIQALPAGGDGFSYGHIIGPHITEKATAGNAIGKYVFIVPPRANKIEISRAIANLYKVKVKSVHVLRMPAKERRVGRFIGEKAGYKKAVVTLQHGEKL